MYLRKLDLSGGCRIHLVVKLPVDPSRMIGGQAATTD
ncbi:hypothetical protein FHT70_005723 [Rhizobium sp. BK049]|nr:hypothetical protein [Rhizobium sp. BK049]